jgi:type IV pilus assembly protein PilM
MFSWMNKNSGSLIGLDFGSNSIKAVALTKEHGTYKITAVAEMLVPHGLIIDNNFEDIPKLISMLTQLRKNFPSSYKNVAIAVAGVDVITKVTVMSASLSELELENQVELEAENIIPFPLDEIFFDFEILGKNADDPEQNDVLLSAARKENVLTKVDFLEDAGFRTKIVDVAGYAMVRACELVFEPDDKNKAVAIIDMGASQISFNIVHQGQIIFSRSKNHGGVTCSQAIVEKYGLTLADAEKAKITGKLPVDCDVDVIAPFVNATVNHLRMDLRMFTNGNNNLKVEKAILIGGGFLMNDLANQIETELNVKAEIAAPFNGFNYANAADETLMRKEGVKYVLALGLALREDK